MLYNRTFTESEPEMTAEAVAQLIVSKQKSKIAEGKIFSLAVSGGSTPNILFSLLADEYADKINWDKIKIFWVDERCVDPTDKESNFGTAYELLLKKVPIPQENILNIRGDNEPIVEVQRYSRIIKTELPEKEGLPVFDLILLGMGDDGHTASIFPDNLPLLHSPEIVATAKHPQTGQNRITLTGEVICNAEQVAFVITGHSKSEVLDAIMNEKGDFERYPAYYILTSCDAELYLDDEAAERL